jgi:hypothetical protein
MTGVNTNEAKSPNGIEPMKKIKLKRQSVNVKSPYEGTLNKT